MNDRRQGPAPGRSCSPRRSSRPSALKEARLGAALSQVALRGRIEPVEIFCLPLEHRTAPLDLESIANAELERRRLGYQVPHELGIAG